VTRDSRLVKMRIGNQLFILCHVVAISLIYHTTATSLCGDSSENAGFSCRDIYLTCGTSATNTVRWIRNPSGSGAFQVLCFDDGWALAMKMKGDSSVLKYSSSYWTDDQLLNADVSYMNTVVAADSKFQPFLSSHVNALLLSTPSASIDLYVGNFTSLKQVFNLPQKQYDIYQTNFYGDPNKYYNTKYSVQTHAGRSSWLSLTSQPCQLCQQNCNLEGINIGVHHYPPAYDFSCRLGIIFNEQNECGSPDSGLMFGIEGVWSGRSLLNHGFWEIMDSALFAPTDALLYVKTCATTEVPISASPYCKAAPTPTPTARPTAERARSSNLRKSKAKSKPNLHKSKGKSKLSGIHQSIDLNTGMKIELTA
jgi:hypothetical protein